MSSDDTADACSNCDIFSIGMIFFFMLTGIIPYDGQDIHEIMKNNKKGEINFRIPEIKRLEPQCYELLKAMLVIDPASRITPEKALEHSYFNDY